MYIEPRSTFLLLLAGMLSSNLTAAPGDDLITTDNIVNLREQPSTESKVIVQLGRDDRLIEVKREGEWVRVYTDRDDIGSGWIHASLVKPAPDYDTAVVNHTGPFKRFNVEFAGLNETWKLADGSLPFTGVNEFINRRIKITASAEWLKIEQRQRDEQLLAIFDLWSEIAGDEKTIEVIILMPDGTPTMSMFR